MHCHAARLHGCGDAIWADPGGYSAGWWLGQGVYLLRFENSLGATVLRFRGAPVPPLAVEVLTRKLGDAADPVSHVALYRRLVADVLAALITLPFAVSGATGHTTEREGAPAGPLFTLHFFLRHGQDLGGGAASHRLRPAPGADPRRAAAARGPARSVPAGALRAALTRSHDWAERSGDQPGWFRRDGRSYLPYRMYLERSEETFDTPENRFVKHFLRLLLRSMEQVSDWRRRSARPTANCTGSCAASPTPCRRPPPGPGSPRWARCR